LDRSLKLLRGCRAHGGRATVVPGLFARGVAIYMITIAILASLKRLEEPVRPRCLKWEALVSHPELVNRKLRAKLCRKMYQIKNNPNHETATGTHGNILLVQQILECDLELVATRTWELINSHSLVKSHILNLDFIVYRSTLVVGHCGG
jgi:hypothetical protein